MRETWRGILLMRSFWLSVTVIAGVLLLIGLRVEGSKRTASRGGATAAEVEPRTKVIPGFGEKAEDGEKDGEKAKRAARRNALEQTQQWVEQELRGPVNEKGWSFPQEMLSPETMERLGVLREAKEPTW